MIPTVFERHQNSRIIRHNISQHYVRTANNQLAALFNPRNRLNLIFHCRHNLTDRAKTIKYAVISTNQWRTLGCSVSFHQFHAQTLHPHIACIRLNCLGTTVHKADIMEIKRMCNTPITTEERIRTKHNCCAQFIYQLSNNTIMQRRRIQE